MQDLRSLPRRRGVDRSRELSASARRQLDQLWLFRRTRDENVRKTPGPRVGFGVAFGATAHATLASAALRRATSKPVRRRQDARLEALVDAAHLERPRKVVEVEGESCRGHRRTEPRQEIVVAAARSDRLAWPSANKWKIAPV